MMSFTIVTEGWIEWMVLGVSIGLLVMAAWYVQKDALTRKKIGTILAGLVALQLGQHIAAYVQTYVAYRNDAVSKYLIPPHNQFLLERGLVSEMTIIINWAMGAALLGAWWWFGIKKTRGRFIDARDIILLTLAAVAVGWPTWLLAYAGIFFLSILGMVVLVLLRKKSLADRLIITPYIIPATIIVLVFRTLLLDWTGLIKIRF